MCVCFMLSACQSRCARFFGLRESPAVCVVCWLRAKHHVRVCVSVSIKMCMFLAAREQEIGATVFEILREHKCQPYEKRRG